jgi:signal transduction histidine kinase
MAALDGEDCNITRGGDDFDLGETSIDLRLWARPIAVAGRGLILLSAMDISAEKRREVLERVFYHDIANTASGMRTILELLQVLDDGERERHFGLLKSASDQLIEEIESQRALKAAESRELAPDFNVLDGKKALAEVLDLFSYKLEGKDIGLELAPDTGHLAVVSDPTLLRRVIVNMIKNAIEAAVRGEVLQVGLQAETDPVTGKAWAVFWVRNSAVMPEVARRRVFHRSFSTKGPGRGVGTYSMKLLAEGYLRGRVSFSSREGEGTIFELRIPQA